MKEIKLTQGLTTQVDDDMFEYLNQWKWYAVKRKDTYYAASHRKNNEAMIFMHRVIMGSPKGIEVDHRDHNGLNNQKNNLRNCTHHQNMMNTAKLYGKVKYRGVCKSDNGKRFRVYIAVNNRVKYLGTFNTEIEAAMTYDREAKRIRGEFANLNFK